MMVSFITMGVPVDQASLELVEIESHLTERHQDPFELFGDPQELARSLVPTKQREALRSANIRNDLAIGSLSGGSLFALIQVILGVLGRPITSLPWTLVTFLLVTIFMIGQMSYSSIMMGSTDDVQSLKPRGLAKVCIVAFCTLPLFIGLLVLTGADLSGQTPVELSVKFWLGIFTFLIAACAIIAVRSWRPKRMGVEPVEGGITGKIVRDMATKSIPEGWIRFGVDGQDLRDPDFSVLETFRSAFKDPKV